MVLKKKIVLLGDSAVGKTSLIRRYVFNQFQQAYVSTIGSKVTMKDLKVRSRGRVADLRLMIWDLIGREGYHALHSRTFVGVQGAILVADLTREETLETIERYWIPFLFKVVEKVPLVFICNKSDLEGECKFEPEELAKIASRYNKGLEGVLPMSMKSYHTTSAKTGKNVEQAFESLGLLLLASRRLKDPIKELYERLVSTRIFRNLDKTTSIGALDAIIVDFCEGFPDSRTAMMILRQEIVRAGVDINNPTKEGILKAVEYLAEAEREYKSEDTIVSNMDRRLEWAFKVRE